MRIRAQSWLFVSALIGWAVACGTSNNSVFNDGLADSGAFDDGSTGAAGDSGAISFGGEAGAPTSPIDSIAISPATASLDVTASPFPTQQFTVTAHHVDGSSSVTAATWSASDAAVGTIDGNGLYAPRGTQGGAVTVTATVGAQTATAALTVKFHQVDNVAGIDAATQASLLAASTADASVVWTYPYDGMAYTRGLNAPELMWNGGVTGDVYAVHIQSATYELQAFSAATPITATAGTTPTGASAFDFDPAIWSAFANSTSGAATITVTRKTGTTYSKIVSQTWAMASRSMSGTIYYWAINAGAVLRIKPGSSAPDSFLGVPTVVPPVGAPTMYCPSCHTVSADGSKLVMGTGPWGQGGETDVWSTVFDLGASKATFNGYETSSPATQFPLAAVSADGNVIVENWAPVRGAPMGKTDTPIDNSAASTLTSLPPLTGTNIETLVGTGHHTYFPVFSADNAYFAYVDSMDGNLYALNWDSKAKVFSARALLASPPASNKIAYPTISPDHRWVVYQVGPDYGSLNATFSGDLYAVDTTNPTHPISLDGINTSLSAAAGSARDEHRSYEPTFAPVASGGYFWLVFHSRRTYGNRLVGDAFDAEGSGTKQLWVSAISVTGTAPSTTDPSHPPFWLPGQDVTTLNMRGYWALDPCKSDGSSCETGTDCCNGFCDATNDAGAPVCGSTSTGCSQVGDRCNTVADCCNSTSGVSCINSVCSDPPPK